MNDEKGLSIQRRDINSWEKEQVQRPCGRVAGGEQVRRKSWEQAGWEDPVDGAGHAKVLFFIPRAMGNHGGFWQRMA